MGCIKENKKSTRKMRKMGINTRYIGENGNRGQMHRRKRRSTPDTVKKTEIDTRYTEQIRESLPGKLNKTETNMRLMKQKEIRQNRRQKTATEKLI